MDDVFMMDDGHYMRKYGWIRMWWYDMIGGYIWWWMNGMVVNVWWNDDCMCMNVWWYIWIGLYVYDGVMIECDGMMVWLVWYVCGERMMVMIWMWDKWMILRMI